MQDSVQDLRNEGRANGQPSVLVILSRQPGANIIETVNQVKAKLPQLQAALPSDVNVTIVSDRSATIRASLEDTKWTLLLSVVLVTRVVPSLHSKGAPDLPCDVTQPAWLAESPHHFDSLRTTSQFSD